MASWSSPGCGPGSGRRNRAGGMISDVPGPTSGPDRKTVLAGKAICVLAARLPFAWPLVSGSVMRFFDRASSAWDDRTGAGSPEHLGALAAAMPELDGTPERVLDLGCGTGAGTLFLAREFPHASIRGLDLSEGMIRAARNRIGLDPQGRVAFRQGDAHRLPYGDESFDLVTQVNMPVFFGEIGRVLRPGGSAVIAHSLGQDTPFSTSDRTLRRGFARAGMVPAASGASGSGTWFLARKPERG